MKHGWARIAIAAGVVFAPLVASMMGGSVRAADDPVKNPMATPGAQRGAKLYESSCAFCHGATGKGATGPSLIDSSMVRHDKDGDLIGKMIREGRLEKGMPAFPIFDKDQVNDLVEFVHARVASTDSRESGGPRSGYQLKKLLSGDAAAGRAYFQTTGGCAKCHSATGDLAGVAKKYQPTELEGKLLYPRGKASTAVVTLPGGKTVQGTLVHLDPFYVAVTDAAGNYHSWRRPSVKVVVNDPLSGHLELLGKYSNKDVHDLFAYLETLQ